MMNDDPILERPYDAFLAAQWEAGGDTLGRAPDLIADRTGQNTIRHAAAIIRGKVVGRTAIDDRAALRHIATFPASRRREAVGVVARQIAGTNCDDKRVASIARRLRRKLSKNEMDETGVSTF